MIASTALALGLFLNPANVTGIYDGDTMTLTIALGYNVALYDQRVRLFGIDAYEVRKTAGVTDEEKARGIECRDELRESLTKRIVVEAVRDRGKQKGKYGRWLVVLWIPGEPVLFGEPVETRTMAIGDERHWELNTALVAAGCAVRKDY